MLSLERWKRERKVSMLFSALGQENLIFPGRTNNIGLAKKSVWFFSVK